MTSFGTTIERTSIRATPGGEVIRPVGAGEALVFEIVIGSSWYKMISLNGVAQVGYINSRSVKVTSVTPPPPTSTTPTISIDVEIDGQMWYISKAPLVKR